MKSASCKAKGRRLQQQIVADLYATFPALCDGDVRSTPMGCPGEDVQLSAKARALVPFSIEAKNQERVNVWSAFNQACQNCGAHKPLVVLKRNRSDPLAVVRWSDMLQMLQAQQPVAPTNSRVIDALRKIVQEFEQDS